MQYRTASQRVKLVRHVCSERNRSFNSVATELGMTWGNLYRSLSGDMRMSTLVKVCQALDISPQRLLLKGED